MTDQIPGAQDWACVTACHRRDAHPVRLGVPAVTASAAPVPRHLQLRGRWSNPAVRPHWVIIGQGDALMAHTWWWNTWNSTVAKSAGTLWVANCIPVGSRRDRDEPDGHLADLAGVRPQAAFTQTRKLRSDPEFIGKARDIADVYLCPPDSRPAARCLFDRLDLSALPAHSPRPD